VNVDGQAELAEQRSEFGELAPALTQHGTIGDGLRGRRLHDFALSCVPAASARPDSEGIRSSLESSGDWRV
jgi:hypothetical protein